MNGASSQPAPHYSGTPFWPQRTQPLAAPPLERDRACDVAVVGAGITGALLADRFSAEGLDVAVIDRGEPGLGSTAASSALMLYELDVPLARLARVIGPERARRAYALGVESIDGYARLGAELDCGFRRCSSLYLARRRDRLRALRHELAARDAAGLGVHWVDRPELRRRWGIHAHAAILSHTAAVADPYRLTLGLLRRAIARGVPVHGRTPAQEVHCGRRDVRIRTGRATIRARFAVMATGYESLAWFPEGCAERRTTYVVTSEPIAGATWRDLVFWELADPYMYARWTDDGRLMVGGADEPFTARSTGDATLLRKSRTIAARFRRVCPRMQLVPAYRWAGPFVTTPDGLGYIGPAPGYPRLLFALGFGGNGMTLSMAAARILAATIRGRRDADAGLFRFGRCDPP